MSQKIRSDPSRPTRNGTASQAPRGGEVYHKLGETGRFASVLVATGLLNQTRIDKIAYMPGSKPLATDESAPCMAQIVQVGA